MSVAQTKMRIASRRNFDKSDIETVYGELVRVIGGSYFIGGVSTGNVQGALDYRNFSNEAGITNAFKTNNKSIFPVQIPMRTYTSPAAAISLVALPWENIGINPIFSGVIAAVSLAYSSMASATNTGTASFSILRQGGTVAVGAAINWTNSPATPASLSNQLGLSVAVQPRDVLQISFTNNVNTAGIVAIVWINSIHVK